MVVKILITVAALIGIFLTWFSMKIKNAKLKDIIKEIKTILADGEITKEEIIDLVKKLIS